MWCDVMWCGVVWCVVRCGVDVKGHRERTRAWATRRHTTRACSPARVLSTIRSPRCGRQREGDLGVVVTANEACANITTTITTTTTTDQARPVAAARSVAVKSAKGADLTYVTQVDACP